MASGQPSWHQRDYGNFSVQAFHHATSGSFSYLVVETGEGSSRACAVIDPVLDLDPASGRVSTVALQVLIDAIQRSGAQLQLILETHVHADHLSAAHELRSRLGGRCVTGQGWLKARATMSAGRWRPEARYDGLVGEGDALSLGGLRVMALHTPGHTPHCISYRIDGPADSAAEHPAGSALFVGDTLLPPHIGTARCDFPGGSAAALYRSIERILAFPPHTDVFVGHDYPIDGAEPCCCLSVEQHRRHNLHWREQPALDEFVARRRQRDIGLAPPALYEPAVRFNSGGLLAMDPIQVPDSQAPLRGVRVAEFCSTAAGPFCAMLLSDMGAEVLKVEPPGGDGLRQWPPITQGFSENFAAVNRNKKSMVLDLKDPACAEIARRLILDCEVLVENNRPGVMDRLGLGYQALRAQHPKLVYCSISAFGQSGPRAKEGGFDLTIQAAAGVMSVTGEEGGAPVKCGVPISDFASGLYGAYAVAAALSAVRAGADGVHIDVPMFGCTLAIAALQTSEYFATGRNPRRLGSAHPRNAPYRAFEASDGHFAIAAGNQALWLKVLAAVGLPELAEDERFKTTQDRATHQAALKHLLEARFRAAPMAHWLQVFREAGVPHSAINDYAAALEDGQVQQMGWVQELLLPNDVKTRSFGSPLRLDGRNMVIRSAPPALGEHTDELLERYGAEVSA